MHNVESNRRVPQNTTVIDVPEGAFLLLTGAPGSGKSTFAQRLFHPDEIISTDAIRLELTGSEADRTADPAMFAERDKRLKSRLRRNLTTVVDATNATRAIRAGLRRMAAKHDRPTIVVVFNLRKQVCRQHDRERDRKVGRKVVCGYVAAVRAGLPDIDAEGFSAVYVFTKKSEVAAVQVRRT